MKTIEDLNRITDLKVLEFIKIRTIITNINILYDDINYWNCKGFEDEVYKKGD